MQKLTLHSDIEMSHSFTNLNLTHQGVTVAVAAECFSRVVRSKLGPSTLSVVAAVAVVEVVASVAETAEAEKSYSLKLCKDL
jgi:hypothetical protein